MEKTHPTTKGEVMEKLQAEIKQLEIKLNNKKKELASIIEMEVVTKEIDDFRKYCGAMYLCGKSGKINEPDYIYEIKINSFGGCVAIPELAKELIIKKQQELTQQPKE